MIIRPVLLVVVLVAVAATLAAQTPLPIPSFVRTYTNAAQTRGLQFQAPVPMIITGLRVPDESQHGMQHVAVYRLATQAPLYPTTGNNAPVFYSGGMASATTIQTSLQFNAGEWVAILGACGDTTTMRNSYGQIEPFQAQIQGTPTSIWRFGTQTNIAQNQGVAPYFSFNAEVGRIEVWYASAVLAGTGTGRIGTVMNLALSAPSSSGLPYVCASALATGPTPIDVRRLGLTVDPLFVLTVNNALPGIFARYVGTLGVSGAATADIVIPNLAPLIGIGVHTAFVSLDGSAPSGVDDVSNTFSFTIQ